jgi:tRNA-dihydrouridine synthase B
MTPLRIGPYVLPARAVLAPMAGVTDRPFRILSRRLGAGLAASEMITCDVRLWRSSKSRQRMNHEGEPAPRVVQLAGADCEALALAAHVNVDLGAEIIDINMGCPAKKVCGRLCGSALLRDEALVERILSAVVRAVDVPVTLKIRTGWDRKEKNAVRIARIAQACGIAALAVHGRTREDFYAGTAEYDTIRAIRSEIAIPLFANGDIDVPQKAQQVLDFTGADGVMIGRAAQGAPWIFGSVNAHLAGAAPPPPLARAEVRAIILGHLESLYTFYGEEAGLRIARKHLGWYCVWLPDAANFRRRVMAMASSAMQFALTRSHLDGWVLSGSAQAA